MVKSEKSFDSYCSFYLVRHGETEFNVQKILQGHVDSPLTELGLEQAKTLANRLKNNHFDAIFSSDLPRASQTAEIIALEREIAVEAKEALRERSFGRFEGMSYDKVDKLRAKRLVKLKHKVSIAQAKASFHPDIETDEKVMSRFIVFVREIAIAYSGKKVLMVSHGGLMRAFLIHIGFNNGELGFGTIGNTSYIKFKSDGVDFFLEETFGISTSTQ